MMIIKKEMSRRLVQMNQNELWRDEAFFTPECQRREIIGSVEISFYDLYHMLADASGKPFDGELS